MIQEKGRRKVQKEFSLLDHWDATSYPGSLFKESFKYIQILWYCSFGILQFILLLSAYVRSSLKTKELEVQRNIWLFKEIFCMFQKLCQPYFFLVFWCTVLWVIKAFSSFFLTSKVTYKFLRTNVFSSWGPATVALKGHPALCWVVQYKVQEKVGHAQEDDAQVGQQSMGMGIPIQGLISIGLSYKCITACLCALLRHTTHTPAKWKNPHACLLNLISGVSAKDITRNQSICSGAQVFGTWKLLPTQRRH